MDELLSIRAYEPDPAERQNRRSKPSTFVVVGCYYARGATQLSQYFAHSLIDRSEDVFHDKHVVHHLPGTLAYNVRFNPRPRLYRNHYSSQQVMRKIRSTVTASAGGSCGMTYLNLRSWFTEDDPHTQHPVDVRNLIMTGNVPPAIRDHLNAGRGVVIPRDNAGALRPIAVGHSLLRLCAALSIQLSYLLQSTEYSCKEKLSSSGLASQGPQPDDICNRGEATPRRSTTRLHTVRHAKCIQFFRSEHPIATPPAALPELGVPNPPHVRREREGIFHYCQLNNDDHEQRRKPPRMRLWHIPLNPFALNPSASFDISLSISTWT